MRFHMSGSGAQWICMALDQSQANAKPKNDIIINLKKANNNNSSNEKPTTSNDHHHSDSFTRDTNTIYMSIIFIYLYNAKYLCELRSCGKQISSSLRENVVDVKVLRLSRKPRRSKHTITHIHCSAVTCSSNSVI